MYLLAYFLRSAAFAFAPSLGAYRIPDSARLPHCSRLNECGEEGTGEGVQGVGALRVPLNSDYEMVRRVQLYGLDDIIGWRNGSDTEVITDPADGLMVAGIHRGLRVGFFRRVDKSRQTGIGSDIHRVSVDHIAAGLMIDGRVKDGIEVLDQGAVAPDVEGLCAVTDTENRLLQVESILEEQLVDGSAAGVGRSARGDGLFSVALRIDIEAAAGRSMP